MIAPERMTPERGSLLLGGLLLLSLVVYANASLNGFVYDDHSQIEHNPNVHSFEHLGQIFGSSIASQQGLQAWSNSYRPLVNLDFLLCYKLFGLAPYGFHLVNIFLNCAVVGLVFVVTAALFSNDWLALVAAAVFALHPVHTEPIAWIDGVSDPAFSLFYLLAFWFFLRQGSDRAHLTRIRVGMIASFALALLSKETAMTFPVLVTVYEHFFRDDRHATRWAQKLARYGGIWATHVIYLVVRARAVGTLAPPPMHPDITAQQAFFSGLALVGQYTKTLVWPVPLIAFCPFQKSTSLGSPYALFGIASLGVVSILFVLFWKRARPYSFALFWMGLTIAPALNARWMAANVYADRYLYLPSVGFSWLVAGGILWCWYRVAPRAQILKWGLVTGCSLVAVAASAAIVTRNRDWRSDQRVIVASLKNRPDSPNMLSDLGRMEWFAGDHDAAERNWALALTYKPDTVEVLANLGMARLEQQRYAESISYLQRAIQLKPRFTTPHFYLARVYLAQGRSVDAETEFKRAIDIYPINFDARKALGQLYLNTGRLREAEEQFLASVQVAPDFESWRGLGEIYDRENASEKAENAWRQAVGFEPFDPHAHLALGRIYLAKGQRAEAQKEFDACLLMDPANAEALAVRRKLNESADLHSNGADASR
jgi:tetratricopeptide (TPR) repeat protein